MKQLIILLIFIPTVVYSKAILWLDITACNPKEFGVAKTLKVLRGDSVIFDSSNVVGLKIIKGLEEGSYFITYLNYLDQEISLTTIVTENKSNFVTICVDKLPEINKQFRGLIDSVTDTRELNITSVLPTDKGYVKSVLKIQSQNQLLVATYKRDIIEKGKIKNSVSRSQALSNSITNKVRQFEFELAIINQNPQRTLTREFYTLQMGGIIKKYVDTTYWWKGIWNLVKENF